MGHSSFLLRGKTGTVVCDPFDPKMVGFKFSSVKADIVTISHDHQDHNRAALVNGVKKVISGPGEYEVMGISILGLPSYHDEKEGANRGKNTIYVLEIDGLRICHLGDLGHKLSENLLEDLSHIDILLIPVGGEYTIGPSGAVAVIQEIEPMIVIPMHYQVPGLNPEIFAKLAPVEEFLKEVGLRVENVHKLSVKKEELGEEPKIVVLEKK